MVVPSSRAIAVLRELGLMDLRGVDLKDIFSMKGIYYEDNRPIVGYLARIVSTANYSMISVSSSLTYKNQKRFVQAHEFGHFELHKGASIIYDDENSFYEYRSNGGQEVEANEFAAELLMPRAEFRKRASAVDFSIEIVREVAEYFETSLTSSGIRYVEFGPIPVALVFSQGGKIKWTRISERFPFKFIKLGQPVPVKSAVAAYYSGELLPHKRMKIDAFHWFYEDYNILKNDKAKVFEEVLTIDSIGSAISFIWMA